MGLSDDIKNNLVDLIEEEIGSCLERIEIKKQDILDIKEALKDFQEIIPEISNNKMATVINNGYISYLQSHIKNLEADIESLKLDYNFNKTVISRLEYL